MSLPADFFATTQSHLDQLITEQAREGPHLEFKRDLPVAWTSTEKHEFLADISAFANAGGGDLIYGIDEDGEAQACAVVPQALSNADQEVRRMQDFLLTLVEPKLPGVRICAVNVVVAGTTGHAVVVRVPQSWVGPHRVKTNQHFFVREGLRKRQLDVPEIRGLFLRMEGQAQRIRDFRTERLAKLLSNEFSPQLAIGPKLVVHFIPTDAARGDMQVNPVPFTENQYLPLLGLSSRLSRLNIDGALAVQTNSEHLCDGYSQLFRNGFFEAVVVLKSRNDEGKARLPSRWYEEKVSKLLKDFRGHLRNLEVEPEVSVMLSLLSADDVQLGVADRFGFSEPHQSLFDRRSVLIPDVLAAANVKEEVALKPVFDLVWQSAGYAGSANYDASGAWAPT